MKANITEDQLAEIVHNLEAAKAFAIAACKEVGRLSSIEKPGNLSRIRDDALSLYSEYLRTAPSSALREIARQTGEQAVDQMIAMIERMGSKPN